MTTTEIAWLAGLIEGEGSIFVPNGKSGCFSPRLVLGMTDEDVVRKAAALMGKPTPRVYTRRPQNPKHKLQWWVMLTGFRAVAVLYTVFTHLGKRRRSKAKDAIAAWSVVSLKKRIRPGIVNCIHAHRSHYAHGVCHACYQAKVKTGELREWVFLAKNFGCGSESAQRS